MSHLRLLNKVFLLLLAADAGVLTNLILRDLAATFDTICQIPAQQINLGIPDPPLEWFKPCQSGRTRLIQLGHFPSHLGGPVLGPILSIIDLRLCVFTFNFRCYSGVTHIFLSVIELKFIL